MKHAILFLSLLTLFASCQKNEVACNDISLTFTNQFGQEISSLTIDDIEYPGLSIGEQSDIICLPEAYTYGELPLLYYTIESEGVTYKSLAHLNFCGTGLVSMTEGVFNVFLVPSPIVGCPDCGDIVGEEFR